MNAVEKSRLVNVLRLALDELIHLGAEEPDIDGAKRQSPACAAIRKCIKDLEKPATPKRER